LIQNLSALGWGLVSFAVIVVLGYTVITQLGNSVGGTANTTANTIAGYLGTGSGGLASWIPIIIVVVVAGLVLAMFSGKKSY